jgi:hypothetical protein
VRKNVFCYVFQGIHNLSPVEFANVHHSSPTESGASAANRFRATNRFSVLADMARSSFAEFDLRGDACPQFACAKQSAFYT